MLNWKPFPILPQTYGTVLFVLPTLLANEFIVIG
jgi:hypothetical protein